MPIVILQKKIQYLNDKIKGIEIGSNEFMNSVALLYKESEQNYIENFSNLISKSINTTAAILPKKILKSYKNQYQKFGCPLSILSQMSIADFLIKDKLINYLSSIEQI